MLQYVPIIGWAWKLSDVIFLERNWEKVSISAIVGDLDP
jgi:1-acyl-sn-glycerol-3-phosphate acyltransferase